MEQYHCTVVVMVEHGRFGHLIGWFAACFGDWLPMDSTGRRPIHRDRANTKDHSYLGSCWLFWPFWEGVITCHNVVYQDHFKPFWQYLLATWGQLYIEVMCSV